MRERLSYPSAPWVPKSEPSVSEPSSAPLTTIDGIPVPELLAQLRAGSREALASLYLAFHGTLWRLAVILVRSGDMAEDIVQDVFLAVWLRREALTPDIAIRSYLYAAVRNEVNMRHRHAKVVGNVETAVTDDVLELPAHGEAVPAPDVAMESSEFLDAYQRSLTLLTERERIALQLRVEQELSLEEIGRFLGVSKMGAHKIVHRALTKIRELLGIYRP